MLSRSCTGHHRQQKNDATILFSFSAAPSWMAPSLVVAAACWHSEFPLVCHWQSFPRSTHGSRDLPHSILPPLIAPLKPDAKRRVSIQEACSSPPHTRQLLSWSREANQVCLEQYAQLQKQIPLFIKPLSELRGWLTLICSRNDILLTRKLNAIM